MIELLRALQVLFVLAWSAPLVLFAKQAWSKALTLEDRLAAAMWYSAFTTIGFPVRWLIQGGSILTMPHDELATWSALYVLGIFSAAYLTVSVHQVCVARGR